MARRAAEKKFEKADLYYSKGFVNFELASADFTRVIKLEFSYTSAGSKCVMGARFASAESNKDI
jgi:hypothetical protein